MKRTQRIALMGVLTALGVVLSYATPIPLFGAKLFPAQAAINVIAGAVLGPWHAAGVALCISLIRIGLGTGSPLAIPGSIFGAFLAGVLYGWTRSRVSAVAGEVVGTGLIGALVSYPIAVELLGNAKAAAAGITFFVVPFGSSSLAGAILGGLLLVVLERYVPQTAVPHKL
ncbi:MAG TPA: energy coupling factor transporter S component ThiW [Symbiobacteriaceae bacterium]|jgi:energy coupling factor transporter S component ThiW|nr:energy coupling factor transporter S component ThiW [Symbiobacteriaceae bacterium]